MLHRQCSELICTLLMLNALHLKDLAFQVHVIKLKVEEVGRRKKSAGFEDGSVG